MGKIFLTEPKETYEDSFKKYTESYRESELYYSKYKKSLINFKGYLQDLDNISKGINIDADSVQTSNFWLIANEDVVGVVRVRHEELDTAGHIGYDISPAYRKQGYGTWILRLSLIKAWNLGIEDVIVTCNTENIASRKIIEKNNGTLLGTVYDEEEDEFLFKFHIKKDLGVI